MTPAFMTIATRGSVRSLEASALQPLGAHVILANTYHLWIRPGLPVIQKAGGLHRFMSWPGPILTDSGGFQVFSLAQIRKITDRGVWFRDDQDGTLRLLTPERSLAIQSVLGSDMAMAFDECPPHSSSRAEVVRAVNRTTAWARRCLKTRPRARQLLFGIVQGGVYKDLRINHARELSALSFDGLAIGGLAVGEPVTSMYRTLDWVVPELPETKPRYLMGVGPPEQLVEAVRRGIDMFDCVLPTRNGRHELLYVRTSSSLTSCFYKTLRISQSKYSKDLRPVGPTCDCPTCSTTTRAYLRHLFATQDPLAQRLATQHNIRFYLKLMEEIRGKIRQGKA